jgi:hypothetical protein
MALNCNTWAPGLKINVYWELLQSLTLARTIDLTLLINVAGWWITLWLQKPYGYYYCASAANL